MANDEFFGKGTRLVVVLMVLTAACRLAPSRASMVLSLHQERFGCQVPVRHVRPMSSNNEYAVPSCIPDWPGSEFGSGGQVLYQCNDNECRLAPRFEESLARRHVEPERQERLRNSQVAELAQSLEYLQSNGCRRSRGEGLVMVDAMTSPRTRPFVEACLSELRDSRRSPREHHAQESRCRRPWYCPPDFVGVRPQPPGRIREAASELLVSTIQGTWRVEFVSGQTTTWNVGSDGTANVCTFANGQRTCRDSVRWSDPHRNGSSVMFDLGRTGLWLIIESISENTITGSVGLYSHGTGGGLPVPARLTRVR